MGSLRDREVASSAWDRQGPNFESCVWRTVSSQSYHHPQEVLLSQFSLYVHKGGLKPDSFHFILYSTRNTLWWISARSPSAMQGGGPAAVVKTACLESRRSRAQTSLWPSSFKEKKVSSLSLVNNEYCREPLSPRRSVLGFKFRLSGLKFRILCLEDSVISFNSPYFLLAQFSPYVHKRGLKPHSVQFISFQFISFVCHTKHTVLN